MSDIQNKYTILIIDDKPENLQLLADLLLANGYLVRAANNGKRAIESILVEQPDLILLDIVMPGMNGFEVCEKIKEFGRFDDIPIIFLSANSDLDNKVKGFEVGGVDYITKPFQTEEVLIRISTHLQIRSLNQELIKNNEILTKKNKELEEAMQNIKRLEGLIPICAGCKKIRDDDGFWQQVESYISDNSEAQFSHSICPDCVKKYYPDYKDPDETK